MLNRSALRLGLQMTAVCAATTVRASAAPAIPPAAVDLFQAASAATGPITDPQSRARAYAEIGAAEMLAGDAGSGRKWFQGAHDALAKLADAGAKQNAMLLLATKEAEAGETPAARALAAEIALGTDFKDEQGKTDAMTQAASVLVAARLTEAAKALFAAATSRARAIVEFVPRAETLSLIARKEAEAGMMRDAKAAAVESRAALADAGTDPNSRYWRDRMAGFCVCGALADTGDIPGAFTLAATINDDYMKSSAYFNIVNAQIRAKSISQAKDTTELVKDPFLKSLSLIALARGQAESGEMGAALQSASAISDSGLRSQASMAIALSQAKSGDLQTALRTATAIPDSGARGEALAALAVAYQRAAQSDSARRVADRITDPTWHAIALARLAGMVAHPGPAR